MPNPPIPQHCPNISRNFSCWRWQLWSFCTISCNQLHSELKLGAHMAPNKVLFFKKKKNPVMPISMGKLLLYMSTWKKVLFSNGTASPFKFYYFCLLLHSMAVSTAVSLYLTAYSPWLSHSWTDFFWVKMEETLLLLFSLQPKWFLSQLLTFFIIIIS